MCANPARGEQSYQPLRRGAHAATLLDGWERDTEEPRTKGARDDRLFTYNERHAAM